VDSAKCTGCGLCQTACPVRSTVRLPDAVEDAEDEQTRTVDAIIDSHGGSREAMITVLQDSNKAFNYLPEEVLHRISTRLGVPYAEVYGAASFYKAFSLEPRGKHIVQVCLGTACHVRGARRIIEEFERRLDVPAGSTTKDRLFTLETVNCLGACALGPIVAMDGEFHGSMTAAKVPSLLERHAGRIAS
jgi:NADH-quinone oxidoreductase subunit E